MDFLIEKNVVKQNRIIIDVGHQTTKIIGCTYTKGEVLVYASKILSGSGFFEDGEIKNIDALAREVKALIRDKVFKNSEIILALPPEMFYTSLIDVADVNNNKEFKTELTKELTNRCNDNNFRISNTVVDWEFLGRHLSQTEAITHFALMGAIPKSIPDSIFKAFKSNGLKLTRIMNSMLGIVYLSALYKNDYSHISNLFIEYGTYSTRFVVQSEGVCILTSVVDVGYMDLVDNVMTSFNVEFNEAVEILNGNYMVDVEQLKAVIGNTMYLLKDEIARIFDTCERSYEVVINQIVECHPFVAPELYKEIYIEDIDVDTIEFSANNTVMTDTLAIKVDNSASITPGFNIAIGCAIAPTISEKKMNLMLTEHKDKVNGGYVNKAMIAMLVLIAVATGGVAGWWGLTALKEDSLTNKISEQTKIQQEITGLELDKQSNTDLLSQYNLKTFEFTHFVTDIINNKPHSITLVSVDSSDRLERTAIKQNSAAQQKATDSSEPTNTKTDAKADANATSKAEAAVDVAVIEERPHYEKDISNSKIIIRGYSPNQEDISTYISYINDLPYVSDVFIMGLEEKTVTEDGTADIFEIILTINTASVD